MKNRKKIIGTSILILVVLLVAIKLINNKKTTEQKVYQYDKEKPITVGVETIGLQPIEKVSAYTGTFEPDKETKISAELQGKINALFVDVGDQVSKGQALLQLDNELLMLQLKSVEVQLSGLEDDLARYTVLVEADAIQGIQLEKTKLALKAAQIQKASLQEQINKTTIRAPFNGTVTAKLNEVGGFAAPGVPLLQITDINILRFTINVPENDLKPFQENQSQAIVADILPDIRLTGKKIMIGSKANSGNSFPIQFRVENTQNLAIKSGMFGKIKLNSTQIEQGILVPSAAIIEQDGVQYIYAIKNNKATMRSIKTETNIGEKVLVTDGLADGDIVVTKGFINLFEGANVLITHD